MRHPVLSLVIAAGLSVLACSEQPTETREDSVAPPQPAFVVTVPCTATGIKSAIDQLFPAGPLRTSAQSQFKSIPPKTNKPTGTAARDKTFNLIGFILQNYYAGKLTGGFSQADRVLALIVALDCFAGVPQQTIPPGALDPTGDGAAAVIMPTSPTTTVVNGNKHAGFTVPTGAVSQPVVVTISRLLDSPGPLLTSLDQYPLFYDFSVSPNVTFNLDVLGGICLRDNVANASALRLAHNVGTSFGAVEILPFASPGFLDCSTLGLSSTSRTEWNHFALAKALFLPAELHATTTTLATTAVGGTTKKFSPFGSVDPGSNPGKILFNPNEATFTGLSAAPGGTVSPAPSVKVTSENGAPIANVPVLFTASTGSTVAGGSSQTVSTDASGVATAGPWVVGDPGTYTLIATPLHVDQIGTVAPYKPEAVFDPASLPFTATAAGPPFGFENGEQEFTGTGFWNRNTFAGLFNSASPTYVTTDGNGFPAPPQGSFAAWYGQPSTGNYIGTQAAGDAALSGGTSTTPNTGTFVSPPFTVPDVPTVSLKFKTWWEIESVNSSIFDLMSIELRNTTTDVVSALGRLNPATDPGGLPAQPFTSGGFNVAPVWQDVTFDISTFRGQNVQLRFDFNTGDNLYNGFRGWIVDDVRVVAGPSFFLAPKLSADQAAVGKLVPADQATFPVRTGP